MVRISAKRMTVHAPEEYRTLRESHRGPVVQIGEGDAPRFDLVDGVRRGMIVGGNRIESLLDSLCERASGPRRVGAFALGPSGELLEYAWSRSETDQTAHAELNLAQAIRSRRGFPLPPGSSIYSSLEPCAMCAAQILGLFEGGSDFRIGFREHDTGPAVHETCLIEGSEAWKRAGSPGFRYGLLPATDQS